MQPKPSKASAKTLLEAFTELPDPRVIQRCDHLLHEVLVIAVCGMLVGGESFYDMEDLASESEGWLRGFLSLPGGIPRHDTFNREVLRLKVRDLEITNRVKDQFIGMLEKDREKLASERENYVRELMGQSHRIGQLETRLLQTGAPADESESHPKFAEAFRSFPHLGRTDNRPENESVAA